MDLQPKPQAQKNGHRNSALIGKVSQENKLREFNFKLIHRTHVTKKELHLFGIENNNRCFYCDESDLIECHYSLSFFNKVVEWFNQTNNCMLLPMLTEQTFGIVPAAGNDNRSKLSRIKLLSVIC